MNGYERALTSAHASATRLEYSSLARSRGPDTRREPRGGGFNSRDMKVRLLEFAARGSLVPLARRQVEERL